jgi:hypothetical protein
MGQNGPRFFLNCAGVPNRAWTLLALEPTHAQQLHGFELVDTYVDLNERRRRKVFLTPKGRALAERILKFWQSAPNAPSVPANVTSHPSVAASGEYWRES